MLTPSFLSSSSAAALSVNTNALKPHSVAAFTLGKLKVDGDVGKALEFSKLIK